MKTKFFFFSETKVGKEDEKGRTLFPLGKRTTGGPKWGVAVHGPGFFKGIRRREEKKGS